MTQALGEAAKAAGAEIKLAGYVRMQLGEGIEKKEDDFAAEVAREMGMVSPHPWMLPSAYVNSLRAINGPSRR